jgi:hypothetical protein
MRTLLAQLSLSRSSGANPDETICLTVEDATSGIQVAEFRMSTSALGELVTGLCGVKATQIRTHPATDYWA